MSAATTCQHSEKNRLKLSYYCHSATLTKSWAPCCFHTIECDDLHCLICIARVALLGAEWPQRTLPLKFWQNKKRGFVICDCYFGFGDLSQELFHSRLLRMLLHINRCVCIGKARDLRVIDFRKFVAGKARANTAVKMWVKMSVEICVSFCW